MKKIIYTTGTLLLAFFCSVTQKVSVQAVSEQVEIKQQCEEILEKDTWKTEQKVVEDCLENFVEEEEKSTQDRKELSDMDIDTGEENYDIARAYRVNLLDHLVITNYQEGHEFASAITETVQWKVPYSREDGMCGVATLIEDNGNFEWIGESVGETMVEIPISRDEVTNTLAQNLSSKEEIEDIIYTYSQFYNMVIVYIRTSKKEYAIPFAEFPDKFISGSDKIINGTVYEMEKFMKIMNKLFDEESLQSDSGIGMGLPYRKKSFADLFVALFVGALFILGCKVKVRTAKSCRVDEE